MRDIPNWRRVPWLRLPARLVGSEMGSALAVAAALLALAFVLVAPAPIHADTTRDLLLARECAEARVLRLHGVPASVSGTVQGAGWFDLLCAARIFGLDVRQLEMLIGSLPAVAGAALFLALRRFSSTRLALCAAALYLPPALWFAAAPQLWNPSAVALPAVLLFWALLALAMRGELSAALACGRAPRYAAVCLSRCSRRARIARPSRAPAARRGGEACARS